MELKIKAKNGSEMAKKEVKISDLLMRFTRMGFLDALSIFKVFLDSIDVSVFVLRRLEKCILL